MLVKASEFPVGSRVESNAYGLGTVTDNSSSESEYQVRVQFDKEPSFLCIDHFYVTTWKLGKIKEETTHARNG